ncbi:MAG: hypothetical protein IPP78_05190 [Holophagaceae bacterium]|nr:hypothetical protein [Holophagaceae bacterium]
MNPFRTLLLSALCCLPLAAQYLTENGEAKILVPHAPFVTGKISRLLLLHHPEAGSGMITAKIGMELRKVGLFEAVEASADDPVAKGVKGLGDLTKAELKALGSKYKVSHVGWFWLDRFHYVGMPSVEVIRGIRFYKFSGSASGELRCSVQDLATGDIKSPAALNLVKKIYLEGEQMAPMAPDESHARDMLNEIGVKRAVQLFIPVHEVRKLPLFTDGSLGELKGKLKSGDLDGAIALARTIQGTSASESPKFKGRLALRFCPTPDDEEPESRGAEGPGGGPPVGEGQERNRCCN